MDGGRAPYRLLDDLAEGEWPKLRSGIQDLAACIAGFAPDLPTGSPLLLSGGWGIGKTSLLKAIKIRLEEANVPVVWFDAWRYEKEASLLPALLRAVWEQSRQPDSIKESVFLPLWRSALTVGLKLAPEAASLVGFGALKPLLKILDPASLKAAIDAIPSAEVMIPPEDATVKLQGDFCELLVKGWPERVEDQKVVILVDDLDRCSPTGMVALLEWIRLLLVGAAEAPCSFVVALDKEVLVQAVARHYAGIAAFDGNRYLEKVFPIHFAVPSPSPVETEMLLEAFLPSDVDDDQRDALSNVLRDPVFANPRLMKRCVNRFRLTLALEDSHLKAQQESEASTTGKKRPLARWIAATERWPALRTLLLLRADDYWSKVGDALRNPAASPPDPEAETLLREPSIRPWLQREMFGHPSRLVEMRSADERLRRWGL